MRKATLILLLAMMCAHGYAQYSAVSFYVVAGPDQWQLFMGANAYDDIVPKPGDSTKVVFIYTTAGDENDNGAPPNIPHYITRQEGAHSCIEFCADKASVHSEWSYAHVLVQGHGILKYTYKNAICYCLRLPDGCPGGGPGAQNLQFLHNGVISSMMAVDSTTTYSCWADLAATMHGIMINESAGIPAIRYNTADTDTVINNGDLPDNVFTGRLCLDALDSMQHFSINLFRECTIANLPANIDDRALANKAALLSQLDYVRTENGLPTEWTPQNVSYLNRCYYKTITK